jgi:hypothetical protein
MKLKEMKDMDFKKRLEKFKEYQALNRKDKDLDDNYRTNNHMMNSEIQEMDDKV